jgi:hypothetical protein
MIFVSLGDFPLKNKDISEEYKDASDRMNKVGKYQYIRGKPNEEETEWWMKEGFHSYMTILANHTLEAAKDSDTVVLTHATYIEQQRLFLRENLLEAGAKAENITMLFLHCDRDVHYEGAWKRWNDLVAASGCTLNQFFKSVIGVPNIVDYNSFCQFQDAFVSTFQGPQESERPCEVVDVTSRDISVLDSIDKVLGIQDTRPKDMTYKEMEDKIKVIDQKRDKEFGAKLAARINASEKEKELAKTEPIKYVARRSSLVEADKIAAMSLNDYEDYYDDGDDSKPTRRRSFLETGKFATCVM